MYNSDSGDFYKCLQIFTHRLNLITSLIQSQGKLRAGNIQPRCNYQSQWKLSNFLALFSCFCSKFQLQPNFSYKTKMHSSNFPLFASGCSHIRTTAAREVSVLGTLAPSLPTTRHHVACSRQTGRHLPIHSCPFCWDLWKDGVKTHWKLYSPKTWALRLVKAPSLYSWLILHNSPPSVLVF